MYPYIENPAIARAIADNEADWAYTYAKEAQEEADKEEAACRRKYYGDEIIKAWVMCDDLGQEDYEKSDQSDFNDFVHNYQIYDLKMKNSLDLGITMPTFRETEASGGKYVFHTQNSGSDTVKSPMGLFDADTVDNDLSAVDNAIRTYYGITTEKETANVQTQ